MDDMISRQAAISRAVTITMFGRDIRVVGVSELESLPSAQPEQRWIPCSERLPEKEVVYIITVHYDDRNFIAFDNFCSYKHGWKEWSNQEVLAWMPLPESYSGGAE